MKTLAAASAGGGRAEGVFETGLADFFFFPFVAET